MYAASVAGTSLAASLAGAYAGERNLEVRGDDLTTADRQIIRQHLGDLVERVVEIRETVVGADREITGESGQSRSVDEILFARLWSFPLYDSARLLSGEWPSPEPSTAQVIPPASSAARCASASIPRASPLTTTVPARAASPAMRRAMRKP